MLVTPMRPVASTPVRSSRHAWWAPLTSALMYPMTIVVALGNQQDEWFANVVSIALALLPPIGGILLGIPSARSGNRMGALAIAIASAWLTFIAVFFVGANYLWSGASLLAPILLAVVLAVTVFGSVEAAWNRHRATASSNRG